MYTISKRTDLINIDTGATYRCVTLAALQRGYTLNDNRCYLKVCKMYRKDGSETFEYIYYPLYGQANVDYSATSDPVLMERNALVVMDENWNVFNK